MVCHGWVAGDWWSDGDRGENDKNVYEPASAFNLELEIIKIGDGIRFGP